MPARFISALANDSDFVVTDADILADPRTGMAQHQWSLGPTIRNKIDLLYDFNVSGLKANDYGRRQIYTADASVLKVGVMPSVGMTLRGVKTSLGGQALMDKLAVGFLQRWGYTPPMLRLAVTYRKHVWEILDSLRVTSALIKNPITGRLGLVNERFEILDINPSWLTEGKLNLLLMWTGAIESSAVPTTSGGMLLVPGICAVTETDQAISLTGSVQFTTAASTSSLTIGLKGQNYRLWSCAFNAAYFAAGQGKGDPGQCQCCTLSYVNRSYTTQVTYHIDYKTSGAPDAAGSGGNPTTGWVTLKFATTRGGVALYGNRDCVTQYDFPAVPPEDFWTETFGSLGASPATYNVKVFYDAVAVQADPCSVFDPDLCSTSPCTGGSLASSTLISDVSGLTVDYHVDCS